MGKEKKGRKHAASSRVSSDPTGVSALLQTASASSQLQSDAAAEDRALLDKLGGSDVQKAVACSGIAHIIANQLRPATSIITQPLLKKMLPLLLERTSYDVAISAAGALRNISSIAANSNEAAMASNKSNPVLSMLLNNDACTVMISLLEAERTQWIFSVPTSAASTSQAAAASSSGLTSGLLPTAAADKRFHFLTQIISALANLSEQFDVVLGYLTANSASIQYLLLLLLDSQAQGLTNSFQSVALQVEISNLLLLVSENNEEFAKCLNRLPAGFGGLAGIVTKLMQRIDPNAPGAADLSPQVRVHCAGILLNLQSSQALISLTSAASAGLPLPGAANAVPVSSEQLCVTSVLSVFSSTLDLDPLALAQQLVDKLRQDRAGVDAQLSAIEKQRDVANVEYLKMAEARHAEKMARKAAAAAAAANGGVAVGESKMDEEGDAGMNEEKNEAQAEVAEEVAAAAAEPPNPSANEEVEMERDVEFADEQDEFESTHKDASGAKGSSAASTSKKSPEVLIASQWTQHLEEKLTQYRQYLLAIRVSLELLTNVCSSPEEEEDMSDSDSDNGQQGLDANQLGYIPKLVLHLGFMAKILNKCHLNLKPDPAAPATPVPIVAAAASSGEATMGDAATTPAQPAAPMSLHATLCSIFPQEDVANRIVELIDEIRNRCINALNNMLLYLPKEVLLGENQLSNLFAYGCQLIHNFSSQFNANQLAAIEEVSNLTNLLFQIARKDSKQVPINKEIITMLVQLGRIQLPASPVAAVGSFSLTPSSSSANAAHISAAVAALPYKRKVQLNVISLLSLLGTRPDSFPYNFVLGSTLLDIVKSAGSEIQAASAVNNTSALHIDASSDEPSFVECASESLNALIDLYSEDDQHVQTQKTLNMVGVLEAFLPLFQSAIKVIQQQKNPRVPKQLIQRLQDNALNAKEFVKYKKQHLK